MEERKTNVKVSRVKKIFSILFCAIFVFSCFSVSVNGAEAKKVLLALGDSISAGYGLNDVKTECFVNGILGNDGITVNKAVSGNTAKDVLDQLQNPENENYVLEQQIKSSDYVTITCGGNDLMAVLYKKTAEIWNKSNPDAQIKPEEVPLKMAGMNFGLVLTVMDILNPESEFYLIKDESFDVALTEYFEILGEITSCINSLNTKVAIIVATQYNPYVEFKGTNLDVVYRGMEEGVTKLNDAIKSKSEDLGYIVSDVKSAFDSYSGEGDLYNADIPTMNVDFHPSAEGHKVLAESFKKTVSEITRVKYFVCYYLEAFDESFVEEKVEHETVLGKKITANIISIEGFSYVEGADGEVKTIVAQEGSMLKLYYSRKTYKIGWHTYEDVIFETYKYGEEVKSPEANRKGYVFKAWDKTIPDTMPAQDMTFIALWEKKSNAPVILIILGIVTVAGVALYIIHLKENTKEKRKNQHLRNN